VKITEIRIKLMNEDPKDRLQAFCSITFDGSFVIRDLKIIQGTRGSFVAMPSRKLTDRCPKCSAKNHLRARFCNDCGARLDEDRSAKSDDGRARLYADIAHPIHSDCREMIQQKVVLAYADELERSKLPGYICTYDDFGEENFARLSDEHENEFDESVVFPMSDGFHRRDTPSERPQIPPHHASSRLNSTEGAVKEHENLIQ